MYRQHMDLIVWISQDVINGPSLNGDDFDMDYLIAVANVCVEHGIIFA